MTGEDEIMHFDDKTQSERDYDGDMHFQPDHQGWGSQQSYGGEMMNDMMMDPASYGPEDEGEVISPQDPEYIR